MTFIYLSTHYIFFGRNTQKNGKTHATIVDYQHFLWRERRENDSNYTEHWTTNYNSHSKSIPEQNLYFCQITCWSVGNVYFVKEINNLWKLWVEIYRNNTGCWTAKSHLSYSLLFCWSYWGLRIATYPAMSCHTVHLEVLKNILKMLPIHYVTCNTLQDNQEHLTRNLKKTRKSFSIKHEY